jgi:hypothetical protein
VRVAQLRWAPTRWPITKAMPVARKAAANWRRPPLSIDRPVSLATAAPPASADSAATIRATSRFGIPSRNGLSGSSAPTVKAANEASAAVRGDGRSSGSMPRVFPQVGGHGHGWIGRDLPGDGLGQVRGDALLDVDVGQAVQLLTGVGGVLPLLQFDLGLGQFVLRLHRDVLTGGHGEGARDQAGHAREHDRAVPSPAAADPGDQR